MGDIRISARLDNGAGGHAVAVTTNGAEKPLAIGAKATGRGSAINGGELLCAALATCYCNDVFREAPALGIEVLSVQVEVTSAFGAPGQPASEIRYHVRIEARAGEADIVRLARHTDAVAEIQNTLRRGMPVTLDRVDAVARP